VEKGNLDTRMPITRGDEFGKLGRRFNHMLEQIKVLKETVHRAQIREYRLKLLQRESEFAALQAQINPHFLYNTLNTMTCMAEVNDFEEMAQMSKSLAKMFKYSTGRSNYTSLGAELQHVQSYMQIIRTRYPGMLDFRLELDEDLKPVRILKLILQPLVENACVHGFKGLRRKGLIRVSAVKERNELLICVTDNGVGISPGKLEQIRGSTAEQEGAQGEERGRAGHIGLVNVRSRLALYYEGRAGMNIESVPGEGTTVRLCIPLELGKEELDDVQYVSG
jgi:two-component system sensor histidine kinase YesM